MKRYSLIFLCIFLPCMLYAETTSDILNDVKIRMDRGTWVPKHTLDVLESKNRDYMNNFVKNVESFTFDVTEIDRLDGLIPFDSDEPPNMIFWYERELSLEPIEIDKHYSFGDVFRIGSYNKIIILDAAYVRDMIRFTVKLDDVLVDTLLDWSKLMENETFDMVFIFDGDYLHIYIDEVVPENLFYTFCRMNDATVNEFKTLMATNTCDLSNVTWPRYADGTSDYDDRIILRDAVGNHQVGKTYLASDIIHDVKVILDNGTWVPEHSLDVLKSKNRDYMSNFVPNIESFTYDSTERDRLNGYIDFDSDKEPNIVFWYAQDRAFKPLKIDKSHSMGAAFYIGSPQNYITILDAVYVGDMAKFTVQVNDNGVDAILDWSKLMENEEPFVMFFIFDGDYLDIYIDEVVPENLFYTFASINDATVNEFKTLMATNTCDLSNVTWPRYADGSSDYDDRIILNDAVGNHEVGKTYLTTDNLRFREKEGVAGEPLFTLPKDTLVKVLKLGATELIDTITADWLQVEVAEDTIDTEGKEVKKGAVGWCFGGYITTSAEDIVYEVTPVVAEVSSEKTNESLPELESTEENTTAQAVPIWAIGGGVLFLVVVGVVILLARKKKK